MVASSIEHYLTRKNEKAAGDINVKAGADKVLQWLAHDGISLKKMIIILGKSEDGGITAGTLEFNLIDPPKDVMIVPVIV